MTIAPQPPLPPAPILLPSVRFPRLYWRDASAHLQHGHRQLTNPGQIISNIRNLTASVFGVAAGALGLESYYGFLFYLLGTLAVSGLIFVFLAESKPNAYFYRPIADLWSGELFSGLMSFVLTWTLFYGMVRA